MCYSSLVVLPKGLAPIADRQSLNLNRFNPQPYTPPLRVRRWLLEAQYTEPSIPHPTVGLRFSILSPLKASAIGCSLASLMVNWNLPSAITAMLVLSKYFF